MGGWHPISVKHPLDAGAHTHGDIETRDAKLTRTSTVKARVSAETESQMWADVEAATRTAERQRANMAALAAAFRAGARDADPTHAWIDNAGFTADNLPTHLRPSIVKASK